MKEITRIHIAKVPYDAEVEAKKELEAYLRTLEAYSEDAEIINDIEIRITEILAERGIAKNGVVSVEDVKALKDQLGEPKDFMGDGDIAIGPGDSERVGNNSRKLYRDVDNAVLGGVMSGVGAFFGINPLWVRLLFIVIALASFGTALLVYIILWIVVPPARTAADKLQMTGRAVTIASIREINESETISSNGIASGRRALTVLAGIMFIVGAIGSIIAVGAAILGMSFGSREHTVWGGSGSEFFMAAFILAVISGVLLTTLFVLAAYAAFAQKITRRVLVSAIIVVVLGLASFGTAAGLAQYGAAVRRDAVAANTHEVTLKLPTAIKTTNALVAEVPGFNVRYVADPTQTSARMRVVTDKNVAIPNVAMTIEGTTLKISADGSKLPDVCQWPGCDGAQQQIIIYGPKLERIIADKGSMIHYEASTQTKLAIDAKKDARVTIESGSVDTLEVTAEDNTAVSAADATVKQAKLTLKSNAFIDLGTVQTLDIIHENSCPAGQKSQINMWSTGTVSLNGTVQSIEAANTACMILNVEGDDNDRS